MTDLSYHAESAENKTDATVSQNAVSSKLTIKTEKVKQDTVYKNMNANRELGTPRHSTNVIVVEEKSLEIAANGVVTYTGKECSQYPDGRISESAKNATSVGLKSASGTSYQSINESQIKQEVDAILGNGKKVLTEVDVSKIADFMKRAPNMLEEVSAPVGLPAKPKTQCVPQK